MALAIITIPVAFIIAASGVLYTFIMMRDTALGLEVDTMIETLVGATGYLTLTTLVSAALGGLLRRTTPALGYYFIVSPLSRDFLPSIKNYFPDTAGIICICQLPLMKKTSLHQCKGQALGETQLTLLKME
ncbi:hypothetical protein [Paenibacillus sp. 22594]|uniref:hypothetical protein n=1 Tax=Paenibacillus sp. 22594 TaxID=3453947 RepID=UPI003F842908